VDGRRLARIFSRVCIEDHLQSCVRPVGAAQAAGPDGFRGSKCNQALGVALPHVVGQVSLDPSVDQSSGLTRLDPGMPSRVFTLASRVSLKCCFFVRSEGRFSVLTATKRIEGRVTASQIASASAGSFWLGGTSAFA
jgi:hypothetical protein